MRNWIINKTSEARLLLKDKAVKKAILKRSADILEKLGIAGVGLGIFQQRTDGAVWGCFFLVLSYLFSIWEAKK